MNGKCIQICPVSNINNLAWLYILRDIPCQVVEKNVIVQHHHIINDEAVLRKVRVKQQSFELTLPAHLLFAQKLFGTAAGIGTRVPLKCRLKQKRLLAEAEDRRQISKKICKLREHVSISLNTCS